MSISLPGFNYRFILHWPMLCLSLVCIALFMHLGLWQIHRAIEKQDLLNRYNLESKNQAQTWSPLQGKPLQYQKIRVKGHYLKPFFLLDNQHHQHQFGYDVLAAFQLSKGDILLIDRGWIAGDPSRAKFPVITKPKGELTLKGQVYFPSQNPWLLGPASEIIQPGLTILEGINTQEVSQLLQKKVYSFIMRLDKQETQGFLREWAIVSMAPERHYGYALQWFAMALSILILYCVLHVKKQ